MAELRHLAHGVVQNLYHLEWATKYRDICFQSTYRRRICEGAIRFAAYKWHIQILALRVLPEHVHCFVELNPSMSPSKAVALLKGISSRMLRRSYPAMGPRKALWSSGKFIRSVGSVTSDAISYYITTSAKNQYGTQSTLHTWAAERSPAL